jgi:hypothetical protein
MTHEERCRLIRDSQDVCDAEIANARSSSDRIKALRCALAVARMNQWFSLERDWHNEKQIAALESSVSSLREQVRLVTEIAETAGVSFPAPRSPSLH